ncbi:MAG: acyl-phosphate glycerol 3-phosphate acyltransferase [Candidatus Omnitrophica bacterium CG22_combo_CG10-13_8_21_14_all_43_16]|nr:MAG: acyl-phosphate glycerol 3-phosphate acyltransferase [Candidatus Omnitrophica bacterium CG22_combo_CG10-13_8_21_14_all_43_16]
MGYFILFLGFIAAYVIGSVPTAYIFGRVLKGIDIREYGSGNVGATNVFRVIGKVPGIIALIIDIIKGFVCATYLASGFMYLAPVTRPELYRILVGLFAIAGHNWTIFLRFKGGKGVAASAGVVIGLIPKIFWLGFLVWLITFFITGFVSLGSIIAVISIPIFTLAFGEPAEIVVFMCLLCLIIVYKHKPNIKRLARGEEKRISFFKKK